MTENEQDAEVMRKVREYSKNEQTITCLKSCLERAAKAVLELARHDYDHSRIDAALKAIGSTNVRHDIEQIDRALSDREQLARFLKVHDLGNLAVDAKGSR